MPRARSYATTPGANDALLRPPAHAKLYSTQQHFFGNEMISSHRPGPDPVRSPPEVPVTPMPQPEIEPAYRPEPEIPEPPPDPGSPFGPQGPEIIPDPSPPEYPDPGTAETSDMPEPI